MNTHDNHHHVSHGHGHHGHTHPAQTHHGAIPAKVLEHGTTAHHTIAPPSQKAVADADALLGDGIQFSGTGDVWSDDCHSEYLTERIDGVPTGRVVKAGG